MPVFSVVAPLVSFLLWHHVVCKVGGAYLPALPSAALLPIVLAHAAALLVGVALATIRRSAALLDSAPRYLTLQALVAIVLAGAAPVAFTRITWFSSGNIAIVAIVFGIATGLAAGSLVRHWRQFGSPRALLAGLLQGHILLLGLLVVTALLIVAQRAGLIRAALGWATLTALVAHRGFHQRPLFRAAVTTRRSPLATMATALVACLGAVTLVAMEPIVPWVTLGRTPDPPVLVASSDYSQMTLTYGRGSFQFFLDGAQKFSTLDGHRSREALVHPVMTMASQRREVLLVEGGDGTALREILRYPDVARVTIVEPDVQLVELARRQPVFLEENAGALASPKLRLVAEDPLIWLRETTERFDVIVLDPGEPTTPRHAKLLTTYAFSLLRAHLTGDGIGVLRTAPSLTYRHAHHCVLATLAAAQLYALPYSAGIPTYGNSGHAVFSRHPLAFPSTPAATLPPGLRYVDAVTLEAMFRVPPDEGPVPAQVNRLHHQVLLGYRSEGNE